MSVAPSRRQQTADQLPAVVGSDSAAATVSSAAIRDFVGMFPTQTAPVIAAQIPEKWLPESADVQFVRLSDEAARAHLQQCGRLLFVRSIARPSSGVLVISVAEGNKCQSTALTFRFILTADGWRQRILVSEAGLLAVLPIADARHSSVEKHTLENPSSTPHPPAIYAAGTSRPPHFPRVADFVLADVA